jgi:hypothetical protein
LACAAQGNAASAISVVVKKPVCGFVSFDEHLRLALPHYTAANAVSFLAPSPHPEKQ